MIFISSFSEPLDINIEGQNSLLLGIQLFIQLYFDGVCQIKLGKLLKFSKILNRMFKKNENVIVDRILDLLFGMKIKIHKVFVWDKILSIIKMRLNIHGH